MSFITYIKLKPHAKIPAKMTSKSTGLDIFSAEKVTLNPGEVKAVGTGLSFDMSRLPESVDVQIRPRSGMALKHSVTVLNSPGTIDLDYQGEIKIILINHGNEPYEIAIGDRIAQMVFGQIYSSFAMLEASTVSAITGRGSGGFGSSGR